MSFRCRPGDVARHLRVVMRDTLGAKTEGRGIGIAGLDLEFRPVNGATVQARWSSGFETASPQPELFKSFSKQDRGRFAGTARRILLLAAVNQAVEKRSGGDDDSPRADRAPVAKTDSQDPSLVVGRWLLVYFKAPTSSDRRR